MSDYDNAPRHPHHGGKIDFLDLLSEAWDVCDNDDMGVHDAISASSAEIASLRLKLEELQKARPSVDQICDGLHDKIAVLKRALSFYADPKHHELHDHGVCMASAVDVDGGDIAREALSLPERKEGDSQFDWIYEAGNWESTYRYADRNDLLDYADSFEVTEFQALTNGPRLWAFVAYTDNGTERVWCTSREDADAKCAAMKDKWLDDNNDPGSTSTPGDPSS